jgi:hypothetical protein
MMFPLTKLISVAWIRERTVPTERLPLGEVRANLTDRGCHVVSVTDPYGRITGTKIIFCLAARLKILYRISHSCIKCRKWTRCKTRHATKLKTLRRDIFRFRNSAVSVFCNRTTCLRIQILIFSFHLRYSRGIPQYLPNIQSKKHNERPLQRSCTVYPRNRSGWVCSTETSGMEGQSWRTEWDWNAAQCFTVFLSCARRSEEVCLRT